MFSKILIANRGEIALRIARTCRELGIRTVIAHSAADKDSLPVAYADESLQVGPAAPRRSYLNSAAIVEAALQAGAQAIHPGYGFLSEDPDFAEICEANGIAFIGPCASLMARLGDKAEARKMAAEAGLPVLPGSPAATRGADEALQAADEVGYPVMIKAAAGGGGRGMAIVRRRQDLPSVYARTQADAQAIFGDPRLYLERYLERTRHLEVQVIGDSFGNTVHLGVRDCSVQRRRQKLIEESPAPGIPAPLAERMGKAAADAARYVGYTGAGTYEFLLDSDHQFYFIEVNCRIQVEHPVTEMVTGLDLVREQILIAAGRPASLTQPDVQIRGVSMECRVNAEDPARDFAPAPGTIAEFAVPGGPFTRIETHGRVGLVVPPYYDSLLAKAVVWAPDRDQAIARMERVLGEFLVRGPGITTTTGFLRQVLANPLFLAGAHTTAMVDQMLDKQATVGQ
ncbi:MAG TPA: acetyl-CoA carboxylase biotin carboxylase subunit [Streptosporangiaceae bacterium]|jgi:acetyl-CoA carboxylase biotin carboxylase subunit|nr:acetyl-CoA carboxylase biotin carboxylase subunit [Streptosporangiaceae bacterium]